VVVAVSRYGAESRLNVLCGCLCCAGAGAGPSHTPHSTMCCPCPSGKVRESALLKRLAVSKQEPHTRQCQQHLLSSRGHACHAE